MPGHRALQDYQAEAGLFRKVHHVEVSRGPKPIDTSEAVASSPVSRDVVMVGPFVDAAFKHFGVTDEALAVPMGHGWALSQPDVLGDRTSERYLQ
eukprot:Skav206069  [mRNA]  locus=scaffold3247:120318:123906:+ [translate_table: standard]